MKKTLKTTLVILLVVMFTACGREEEVTKEVIEECMITSSDVNSEEDENVNSYEQYNDNDDIFQEPEKPLENRISLETLEQLPEEPDWREVFALERYKIHMGNYNILPEENIKHSDRIWILDDFGETICDVDSDTAIFRNNNDLVCIEEWGNNKVSRTLYSLDEPGYVPKEYYQLADNTAFYYLAEDGLYYYIMETGTKQVIKVTDNINCNEYECAGIVNFENINYPIFETKNYIGTEMFVYPLEEKTVKEVNGWFYVIE